MPYMIDIDTGGTFTDGFISGDGRLDWVKVDTTPHDLTLGFFNCLEEAAKRLDLGNTAELLARTDVIRFSTTIGTNTLIQKAGPKLGLIVSQGYKKNVYSKLGDKNPILDYIVRRDMVSEIRGEIDPAGNIAKEINEDEVRDAVKELLVRGARVIVVSLLNSSLNPSLEKRVKGIVEGDYPKHYLGSVPLLSSFEVSLSRDNETRTNAALLDAYMHREMARFLYSADERLLNLGYINPLLVVHNWGGVARVAKTRALHTYDSGPAAGLFGVAFVGNLQGLDNIVSIDIGGTSTDIGIVIKRKPPVSFEASIGGITVKLPLVTTFSIGAGGGSIAKAVDKNIKVGPESAGALPGPACYDLGGMEATVTDAYVALGYIDPGYFLGGRRKLNLSKAFDAIKENVAQPLNLEVEEAALKIVREQESLCVENIRRLLAGKRLDAKGVTMLSFGGAGGIHCSEIARALGIKRIYIPPFAAAFSAFGSSTMDIIHEYESPVRVSLRSVSGSYLSDFQSINQAIASQQQTAIRDMRAEGVAPEKIMFDLELELRASTSGQVTWLPLSKLRIEEQKEVKSICEELSEALSQSVVGEIILESIRLRATGALPHSQVAAHPAVGKNPEAALRGKRGVFWETSFEETPIYEQRLLQCGNEVTGPAVIEGEDTTILLPKGTKYSVDKFLFGIIEEA